MCGAIADAARRGTACLVFGRDPALRRIAEREGWRQLALLEGTLRPLSAVDGAALDDLMVDAASAPVPKAAAAAGPVGAVDLVDLPNVVPFPVAARPAGAR